MCPLLYLLTCCLIAFPSNLAIGSATHEASSATKTDNSQADTHEVTLFSRLGHKESGYAKSAFSFRHGLRSDSEQWLPVAHNDADLLYGSISINGCSDWFCVSMGGENPSKIRDLGELEWSNLGTVPVLLATPPTSAGIRGPRAGESYEDSSEQRVTKAVSGHLYLTHIKNGESDIYAVFRVEELSPSDFCLITWKLVTSPENDRTGLQ
jgi:hypothetical protein